MHAKWILSGVVGAGMLVLAPVLLTEAPHFPIVLQEKPVTILAWGDMMLDRTVRAQIDAFGPRYPFEYVADMLRNYDLVVANAEGVFSSNPSISVHNHSVLRFTFATSTLPTLASLGFSVLSQANNHAYDFGAKGFAESAEAIRTSGIDSFGDPYNRTPGPLYKNIRGTLVAFVGYHQFLSPNASSTLAAIAQAKLNSAFVIVYPHWGEEYNLGTTSLQTILAHKFIDAGADVVIGAHPHVVEPQELYKGKMIFYSIGNFIFDQKWDSHVSNGLAVAIALTKKNVTYTLYPFTIVEEQAHMATSTPTSFVLER